MPPMAVPRQAARVSEQTIYTRRKRFGGMSANEANRLLGLLAQPTPAFFVADMLPHLAQALVAARESR